jgi:hypothetical protein
MAETNLPSRRAVGSASAAACNAGTYQSLKSPPAGNSKTHRHSNETLSEHRTSTCLTNQMTGFRCSKSLPRCPQSQLPPLSAILRGEGCSGFLQMDGRPPSGLDDHLNRRTKDRRRTKDLRTTSRSSPLTRQTAWSRCEDDRHGGNEDTGS